MKRGNHPVKPSRFVMYPRQSLAPEIVTALDRAKMVLRQRGIVCFNADITDGPPGRGFVKCDGRNLKPAEVIAWAEHLAGRV